jgi:hypothetical protein
MEESLQIEKVVKMGSDFPGIVKHEIDHKAQI